MQDNKYPKEVPIKEHYDLLIDEEIDPARDGPALWAYMSRWDDADRCREGMSERGANLALTKRKFNDDKK